MPPKKRGSDADSPEGSTTAPKRQRVSLACDACRTAREKCDGGKPTCATCVAQSRACSYTPTSKKRGVQTGYLRTIEMSLAWLFDNVPETEKALHRLLVNNDGLEGGGVLAKTDKSGHRLHKRWSKSRVHKEIGRLLSDDRTPRTDNSGDDSDSDGDAGDDNASALGTQWSNPIGAAASEVRIAASPLHTRASPLKLPRNWRRLIGIYFSYTHCWLPILDRDAITTTATLYPPEGLVLDSNLDSYSTACHAELWAALAVAAFQDASSQHPTGAASPAPSTIYSVACSLVPSQGATYELPHLGALLLHSLVLIGQESTLEAWLVVGKVTRLALHMHSTGRLYPEGAHMESSLSLPGTRIFAACFLFDTLISLWLGQPTSLRASTHDILPPIPMEDSPAVSEAWTPVSGLGPTPQDAGSSQPAAQPLLTFHQLYRFSRILNANAESKAHQCSASRRVTPDDLVKSLDPQFGFCNSLIFGGSTPVLPSAFLLQATFLTATVELVAGHRASLLSSFMEIVDSCVSNFSACGTPPVVIVLLGIMQRGGHVDSLHDSERSRWKSALDNLTAAWRPSAPNESPGKLYYGTLHQPPAAQSFTHNMLTPTYQEGQDTPGVAGYTIPPVDQPADNAGHYLPYERRGLAHGMASAPSPVQAPARAMAAGNMPFQSPALGRGHQQAAMLYSSGMASQHVDYDAILEELGSIDCTDNIEVDPQFMTNLGFTPGYNLGEMFHEDFGV